MSKLYLVGTPIGNMGDITLRALETLKNVDVIACEDTRHTLGLLNFYQIKKPLISYYKQKENEGARQICKLLEEGKDVALVTDAGMPCISDPGSILVRELQSSGYEYTVVPGASAVVSAMALAGVEGGFCFVGFLPDNNKASKILLQNYISTPTNLIFYCAPHDLNDTLDKLYDSYGNRKVTLVKEITKMFEKVIVGELETLRIDAPKGEFVIIVEPDKKAEEEWSDDKILEELKVYTANGMDKKEAVYEVALNHKLSKNKVYKIALKL